MAKGVLPDSLLDERDELIRLKNLGTIGQTGRTGRTTTGEDTFSSDSSGTSYDTATYNGGIYSGQGETGMLQIMTDILVDYLWLPDDANTVESNETKVNPIYNYDINIIRATKNSNVGIIGASDSEIDAYLTVDNRKFEVIFDNDIPAPCFFGIGDTLELYAIKDLEGNDLDVEANTVYVAIFEETGSFFELAPRGGGDTLKSWLNDTQFFNQATICEPATGEVNRVTVNGSGWLVAILGDADFVPSDNYAKIKIDGSYWVGDASTGLEVSDTAQTPSFLFLKRFETSLEVDTTRSEYRVVYLLGDKYDEALLKIATSSGSSTSTTTRLSVTGSGWLFNLNVKYNSQIVKLAVDGVEVTHSTIYWNHNLPIISRFETGFVLEDTGGESGIVYVLD